MSHDETSITRLTLVLTKHITPHANGEPLLKRSSSHSHSSSVLLVIWSANSDGIVVNLLRDDTDGIEVSSFGQIEQGAH